MLFDVTRVDPFGDRYLYLEFRDGKTGIYDVAPLFGKGVFKKLENPEVFKLARTDGVTVTWPNDLDIAPEELYRGCVRLRGGSESAA